MRNDDSSVSELVERKIQKQEQMSKTFQSTIQIFKHNRLIKILRRDGFSRSKVANVGKSNPTYTRWTEKNTKKQKKKAVKQKEKKEEKEKQKKKEKGMCSHRQTGKGRRRGWRIKNEDGSVINDYIMGYFYFLSVVRLFKNYNCLTLQIPFLRPFQLNKYKTFFANYRKLF